MPKRNFSVYVYIGISHTVFNTFTCFLHSMVTFISAATKLLLFLVLDKIQRATTNWWYNPYLPFS